MIIDIAQDQILDRKLKGQTIFPVHAGFKDSIRTVNRMHTQGRIMSVSIQLFQGPSDLCLNLLWQLLVSTLETGSQDQAMFIPFHPDRL